MGYEDEMSDWYEEQNINVPLNHGSMKFNKKNLYICRYNLLQE